MRLGEIGGAICELHAAVAVEHVLAIPVFAVRPGDFLRLWLEPTIGRHPQASREPDVVAVPIHIVRAATSSASIRCGVIGSAGQNADIGVFGEQLPHDLDYGDSFSCTWPTGKD